MTLTGGRVPRRQASRCEADAEEPRRSSRRTPFTPDGKLTFSKVDAVFKSGNADARRHPVAPDRRQGRPAPRSPSSTRTCARPASTSAQGDELVVNAPNCVDCKATDVLGPRWTPREGGSGPRYKRM